MSIRMIAIDLDGTLLHDDMTISDYSREVIQKAMKKGYQIVVATGRMWDSAKSKVARLHLGNVPVICYTGAWITWHRDRWQSYEWTADPAGRAACGSGEPCDAFRKGDGLGRDGLLG